MPRYWYAHSCVYSWVFPHPALLGYYCLAHQVDEFLPYWLVFCTFPKVVPVFVASSARGASYIVLVLVAVVIPFRYMALHSIFLN